MYNHIYKIVGIGSTTVYTIGAPYLDDSIDNKNSPLYFGITIAVRGIGPVLGISLSSACVRLYVDLNSNPSQTQFITPSTRVNQSVID